MASMRKVAKDLLRDMALTILTLDSNKTDIRNRRDNSTRIADTALTTNQGLTFYTSSNPDISTTTFYFYLLQPFLTNFSAKVSASNLAGTCSVSQLDRLRVYVFYKRFKTLCINYINQDSAVTGISATAKPVIEGRINDTFNAAVNGLKAMNTAGTPWCSIATGILNNYKQLDIYETFYNILTRFLS